MASETQLSVATMPAVSTIDPIMMIYIIAGFFLAIISLFLWIDQGSALPFWTDQDEIERQKLNNWWLQDYHEERKGSRPTGILRHRRNISHCTENYISIGEGDSYSSSDAPLSSPLFAAEKLKSSWENKVKKHVRFEIPLSTMTVISTVLGDGIDDSMNTMQDHGSYYYDPIALM